LWIDDKWRGVRRGLIPCLITGLIITLSATLQSDDNLVVLTGVIAHRSHNNDGSVFEAQRQKIIDKNLLTDEELAYEKQYPLWKALIPG
jgi:lactate permease